MMLPKGLAFPLESEGSDGMRSRTPWWVIASIVLMFGCEGASEREAASIHDRTATTRDSSGITVVETPATVLEAKLDWVHDPTPDLELGSSDGEAENVFAGISGISGFGNGDFVVLDGESAQLRWFSRDGRHMRFPGSPRRRTRRV